MFKALVSGMLLLAACTASPAAPLEAIQVSKDGKGFVRADSGRPFIAWGFNYDRDYRFRLIEDYWDKEWATVESDFRQMQQMGANVVRVHLQFGKFMDAPDKPNAAALARLEKLVTLAESLGLYLDVTGLGCYRLKDQPAWYAEMVEKDRWAAQAAFWEAIARRCAGRSGVLAFDLVNEPVVGNKLAPGKWVHEAELGGFHYVQFIALDQGNRDGAELWREWTHTLASTIHKQDPHRLVTVGLLPLPNRDMLRGVSKEVDYISVHLYPKKGKIDDDIRTLQLYSLGKPLIIEETFPLECSEAEMLDFLEKSRGIANGWISFYWGQPIAELKTSKDIGQQMLLHWLEQFQKMAPAFRGEPIAAPGVTSGGIEIDWPVNRTVMQRSASNTAVLRISGKCSPKTDRIEARLVPRLNGEGVPTGWQTVATPTNGTFGGFITGQGGWYDLQVRARAGNAFVATSIVERVGIGEVFVVVGHSVAAGQKENIDGATDDRVNTVPLDKESASYRSYERTGDPSYLPAPSFAHYGTGVIPAPFGCGNYFWSKFGEQVAQKQNVPVLIYNAAFGGTSLEHWAKSARNIQFEHSFVKAPIRMPYINLHNTLRKYIPRTGLRAVLADQGQNDWPEKNEELVFQNYLAWVEQARADLPHPELAIVINRQTPFLRDSQIRRVQERMIRRPACFAGPDYDTLPKEARPDTIHLGLAGQEQAAQLWAGALDDKFFKSSKPWLPVANNRDTAHRESQFIP